MPRTTEPELQWHRKGWRPSTHEGISKRVVQLRPSIAKALALEDDDEIDAAVQDLITLLIRTTAFVHEADRTATVPRQRANVIAFRDRGDYSEEALDALDPATRFRILKYHPAGSLMVEAEGTNESDLQKAVEAAVADFPSPQPGKPEGSASLALKQFALGSADLFHRHTGQMPARRVDRNTGKEVGAFHEFVSVFFGLLPFEFQFYKNGRPRGVSAIVKEGSSAYRKALSHPNPTRRWSLDDRLYLEP